MVRALLPIAIVGCHIGAGPVVAYSPQTGVRAGLDVSGGVAFVRGSFGATWAPIDGPSRRYLTFDPGYVHRVHSYVRDDERRYYVFAGGGATIGKAYGPDVEDGAVAVGAWATASTAVTSAPKECTGTSGMFSVAIGYRWLARIGEVFIAPKLNLVNDPFACSN